MARLQAESKMNFFPVAPEVVDLLAKRLSCPAPTAILDPCAGKGAALAQLCDATRSKGWTVELDDGRYTEIPAGITKLHASFLGTRISPNSFGLAWVNPPFQDETGGRRRAEYSFLVRATPLVAPGSVMVFMMPHRALSHDIRSYWSQWYDESRLLYPPPKHREYDEIILVGKRKKEASYGGSIAEGQLADSSPVWEVPAVAGPKVFIKTELTPSELQSALAASPLHRLFQAPPEQKPMTCPLSPGKGHVALLLAAGRLNGVVHPSDDFGPHVVRGVARKDQYVASTTVQDDDNKTVTTTVLSEKIVLSIRLVKPDGTISTLS